MLVGIDVSVEVGEIVGMRVVVTSFNFVVCSKNGVTVLVDTVVGLLHALRSRIAKPKYLKTLRGVGYRLDI